MLNADADADANVLNQILTEAVEAEKNGRAFLTVFDLDSTLLDLTQRVATIIQHFLQKPETRQRFAKEADLASEFKVLPRDWGIKDVLLRAGVNEIAHRHFLEVIESFWRDEFFSDRHLHHDQPIPGALTFVRALYEAGSEIVYLTGRDVARMAAGTERSLLATGFPLCAERARLILKPEAAWDDAQFKLNILRELSPSYPRIWLFENEPVNLNLIARHCPEIGLVFIDTTHSGREEPDGHFKINDFRLVSRPPSSQG